MKSLEWKGIEYPPYSNAAFHVESLAESMDRLHHEKYAKFRRWQDAITMNMIFGDNYVTVPEIPKGYEDFAKWWHKNELKAFK